MTAKPPADYDEFLAHATDIFVQKDTDYDSRFMRGMIKLDARTLWEWEVDKKLDRIRTWLKRGELQVKGEGVENSVVDLFNYTVQYCYYNNVCSNSIDSGYHTVDYWQSKREILFFNKANKYTASGWVSYLVASKRIGEDEVALQQIIRLYMGDKPSETDWKDAIKAILSN